MFANVYQRFLAVLFRNRTVIAWYIHFSKSLTQGKQPNTSPEDRLAVSRSRPMIIHCPVYLEIAKKRHLAPWASTYFEWLITPYMPWHESSLLESPVTWAAHVLSFFLLSLSLSQILDGAVCRAFKVQREFVGPLQVTHLPPVWNILLPLL